MKDGSIPYDPVIARQAGGLAARLPAADAASGVNESASIEACDAMISTLLATMTKGTTQGLFVVLLQYYPRFFASCSLYLL